MNKSSSLADTLILFDVDGTLIRCGCVSQRKALLQAISDTYSIKAEDGAFPMAGMTDLQIGREYTRLAKVPDAVFDEKSTAYVERGVALFLQYVSPADLVILNGVKETLQALRKTEVALGLLTGNFEPIAWKKIALLGLDGVFTLGGFGNESLERYKLFGFAIQKYMQQRKKKPARIVYIGDTPRDIDAAQQFGGIEMVAVATGRYSKEELIKAAAPVVIERIEELLTIARV